MTFRILIFIRTVSFDTEILTMIFFLLFASIVTGSPENFRVSIDVDGQRVNEDVLLDMAKKTLIVNIGGVGHLHGNFHSSINLHDFNVGKVALKFVDQRECLISDTSEDLEQINRMLHNLTDGNHLDKDPEKLFYKKNRFPIKNLSFEAGTTIENFCKGYISYRANLIKDDNMAMQSPIHDTRMNIRIGKIRISICFISIHITQADSIHQVDTGMMAAAGNFGFDGT